MKFTSYQGIKNVLSFIRTFHSPCGYSIPSPTEDYSLHTTRYLALRPLQPGFRLQGQERFRCWRLPSQQLDSTLLHLQGQVLEEDLHQITWWLVEMLSFCGCMEVGSLRSLGSIWLFLLLIVLVFLLLFKIYFNYDFYMAYKRVNNLTYLACT